MAEKNVEVIDKESKQYIVVMVGSEQYGIDISYIDNIVRMQKITRVPKIQSYFKGVINLEEKGAIGVIVDEVKEVVNLSEDEIEKSTNKGKFINGIGKHGDDLISLLEINSVVDDNA